MRRVASWATGLVRGGREVFTEAGRKLLQAGAPIGERYRRISVPLAETQRDLAREQKEIMDAALARDANSSG